MTRLIVFVLVFATALCCKRAERSVLEEASLSSERPNVLLVTIDTLRADRVGCYGDSGANTATLDGLAAEGTYFETAIASSPLTLPSHVSLLTGLYPPHHGVRHNGLYRLPDTLETLAERLRAAGHATGAVVGSAVLARRYGVARGFDHFDDDFEGARASESGFHERGAAEVTAAAAIWLRRAPEPFFAWVHYYDPHLAYAPPSPYAERHAADPYAGEVAYVDDELDRLFQALRSRGIWKRTLVVVTSDHGESLGEHGERDHSYTLYDAAVRVPLIVRGPGIPRGRAVGGVVRTVDVAPTVLALLGLPPLPRADGEVLPGLAAEPSGEDRLAYAETLATRLDYGWSPLFAIRSATHLFVRAPRLELYELANDSQQVINLLEGDPVRELAIASRLDRSIREVLDGEVRAPSHLLESRELEQLRALGYAVPDAPVDSTGLDPKDGLPLLAEFREGVTAFTQGDLEAAERRLGRVVPKLSQSALVRWVFGNVLFQSGKQLAALREIEEAARLSPRSARYRAMVGEVRRRLGDPDGATAAFEAAAGLDSAEPLAQVGLAWASWRRGDTAAAEVYAAAAAREGALEPTIHTLLAELWSEKGRGEEAVGSLREALRLGPGAARTRMFLAVELARLGRSEESEAARRAAGSLGNDPGFVLMLGRAHEARGAIAEAERVYRDSLAARPGNPRVEAALARIR